MKLLGQLASILFSFVLYMGLFLVNKYTDFLYGIGFFSEFIMPIMVIYLLYSKWFSISIFFVGYIINALCNIVLKGLLHGRRPTNPTAFLANEKFNKTGPQQYGMPSGHSQNVFYCIAYLYSSIPKQIDWILLSFIIGILTILERYVFHNHTIGQLIVGAIVGFVIGSVSFSIGKYIQKDYHIPSLLL
jgi:membrane-associated phospholipid phosphatase